jgi:hypothetical protein
MTRYFRWQSTLPLDAIYPGSWQKWRAADNLDSIHWLYNRTGERWLLDLGRVNYERTADWAGDVPTWHGVNLAQCFRGPAQYYQQTRDPRYLKASERVYDTVIGLYGSSPAGVRRRRERAGRASRPAPGHGELHLRRADALPRDARAHQRRVEVGGPRGGGGVQLAPRGDDSRPEGPALPDGREHGAARPQEQGSAPRQRGRHALLQPVAVPLLPAQRGLRLALLRREPLDGHGGRRAGGGPVRPRAAHGDGRARGERGRPRADRVPVRRGGRDRARPGAADPVHARLRIPSWAKAPRSR